MNIFLKAEVLAGTHIEEAIREAKELAEKLGVGIKFDFNGVPVAIFPWSDVKEKVEDFRFEFKRRAEEEKKNERGANV